MSTHPNRAGGGAAMGNVFGCHMPESLNYTVYYIVSQQFGTRGRQEHHQIRIEDLKWIKDPDTDCTIYIELHHKNSKRRIAKSRTSP